MMFFKTSLTAELFTLKTTINIVLEMTYCSRHIALNTIPEITKKLFKMFPQNMKYK